MKFTVQFKAEGENYPVQLRTSPIGLSHIETVREKFGVDIPLDEIDGSIQSLDEAPSFEISEEMARETGYFTSDHTLTVTCPESFLNHFVEVIPESNRYLAKYSLCYLANQDRVLHAWKLANYPILWDNREAELQELVGLANEYTTGSRTYVASSITNKPDHVQIDIYGHEDNQYHIIGTQEDSIVGAIDMFRSMLLNAQRVLQHRL